MKYIFQWKWANNSTDGRSHLFNALCYLLMELNNRNICTWNFLRNAGNSGAENREVLIQVQRVRVVLVSHLCTLYGFASQRNPREQWHNVEIFWWHHTRRSLITLTHSRFTHGNTLLTCNGCCWSNFSYFIILRRSKQHCRAEYCMQCIWQLSPQSN